MKYELTDDTITIDGIILHQIKALRSFGNVTKGDLGGWVEKEDNLSQMGDAWIYIIAKVYGNALICNNAWIGGNAKVHGNAVVCDNAMVEGNAEICKSLW